MSTAEDSTATDAPAPKYWNKIAEETLRKKFLAEQRKACNEAIRAYTLCAKEEGFSVIWNCRGKLEDANNCLHPLTTDEQFHKYKKEKIEAWVAEGVLVRPKDF